MHDLLDAIDSAIRTYALARSLKDDPRGCLQPVLIVVGWTVVATVSLFLYVFLVLPVTGLDLGLVPFLLWFAIVFAGPLWTTHRLRRRR